MKLVKFIYKKNTHWGIIEEEKIVLLKKPPYTSIKLTSKKIPLNKIKILPPANPSKIVLVGLNYKDHAKELNMPLPKEPIIFLKPPTSLIAHQENIIYPKGIKRLDYEAELAIVIKKKAKNVSVKEAKDYILGYTCLNDITARDLQKKDGQWTRAKSFDTFCPLGPCIVTDINPMNLKIQTFVNGVLKQDSSTSNIIFSPFYLVSFISKIMTLLPQDIISTGTPSFVGSLKRNDTVEVVIEKIGVLKNYVK
ncbi:MAG: fumarylacetoacetate hydrolase family protein [Candidatus Omnitrophica bacterium]|nr:fumarylacetoacetate hydrolase family protein [Candidatus Omnitrophota bacterium]